MIIIDMIIQEKNYYNALCLMEDIKQWRTKHLNNYLYESEQGKKVIENIMKLKLSLIEFIYSC